MRWPLAGIGCLIAGLATGAAGRWAISAREAGRAHEESGTGAVDAEGRKASDAAKADALAEFSRGAGDGPRLPTEKLQRFSGLEYLERLARWLPEATAEELAAVIQAPDDPDRDLSAEAAIFLRWAELDPQGAVRFARNRGNAAPAWEAWAQVDSEAGLAPA